MPFNSAGRHHPGLTLLEVLLVAAIIGLLAAVILSQASVARQRAILNLESERLLALINQTRGETLQSAGGRQYGLQFNETEIKIFAGVGYQPDQVTAAYTLDPQVRLSAINLSHGATEVVFARLTGVPSATGTVTVSLATDAAQKRLVIIEPSGIIRIE